MFVTQIDVGAFAAWATTNVIVTNKITASFGLYPTILYVADKRNLITAN